MKYTIGICGKSFEVELFQREGKTWAKVKDKRVPVELKPHGGGLHTLLLGDRRVMLWLKGRGTGYEIYWQGRIYGVELEPSKVRALRRHLRRPSERGLAEEAITAHMPGLVVKVEVEEGQRVKRGDGLLVIEAMKMENEIRAPCDGTVKSVAVQAGREVNKGELLCVICSNEVHPNGPEG